jgi:hypothetical protein
MPGTAEGCARRRRCDCAALGFEVAAVMSLFERTNAMLQSWQDDHEMQVGIVVDPAEDALLAELTCETGIKSPEVQAIPLKQTLLPINELPMLMFFSAQQWQLRQRSVELAIKQNLAGIPWIYGWVGSTLPREAIAHALAKAMIRRYSGSRRFLFRLHDPRVRQCLGSVLGPAWLSQQVSSPINWAYLGRDTELFFDEPPAAGRNDLAPTPERAETVIQRCAEINQIIDLASEAGWRFNARGFAVADSALSRVEQRGFTGAADRMAFALHVLTVGPNFDAHPAVQSSLDQAIRNGLTYVEAMSALPASQWQEIQSAAQSEKMVQS